MAHWSRWLHRVVRSICVSDPTLFWICWHGRSWRQETKLSHHADIVTSRVVVHDLSVPELKPLNMIRFEVFSRRRYAHKHAPVHGNLPGAAVGAAYFAPHND